MAGAAAEPAGARERGVEPSDHGDPRRVAGDLRGAAVSRQRVSRLMRALGRQGVTRRRRRCTTRRDREAAVAPDRVQRRFEAAKPNQVWVADITCVPTQEGFLYLATVLDVFSRKVVGWAMSARQTVELVQSALEMALETRAARGVVFHSDRGCQYTALAFSQRCAEAGIQQSMGRVGSCFDNAMAESLFATVECELLQRTPFESREQAQGEIFKFLEGFYNRRRRHSALGYLSPVEFEHSLFGSHPRGPSPCGECPGTARWRLEVGDRREAAGDRLATGTPRFSNVISGLMRDTGTLMAESSDRHDLAIGLLERARKYRPNDSRLLWALGRTYRMVAQAEEKLAEADSLLAEAADQDKRRIYPAIHRDIAYAAITCCNAIVAEFGTGCSLQSLPATSGYPTHRFCGRTLISFVPESFPYPPNILANSGCSDSRSCPKTYSIGEMPALDWVHRMCI